MLTFRNYYHSYQYLLFDLGLDPSPNPDEKGGIQSHRQDLLSFGKWQKSSHNGALEPCGLTYALSIRLHHYI